LLYHCKKTATGKLKEALHLRRQSVLKVPSITVINLSIYQKITLYPNLLFSLSLISNKKR